ncbi:MAG: zinc ribbon domain-containing protein [Candidatus Caldatribacterium sp.]|nr:zinc ribbon domain-containing protein [Candidatus Caldatribacterium sp.]
MNFFGYLLIIGVLLLVGLFWGTRKRGAQVSVTEFWQEKEREFGETRVLSSFARYLGGHPRFENATDGLLFLMSKSLWFENFEKGPNIFGFTPPFEKVVFRIPLHRVLGIEAIPERVLAASDFGPRLFRFHRLSRAPLYLGVRYVDEWDKEHTLYFDSMVDVATWQRELDKTKASYVPEEERNEEGVCPSCGERIAPDFRLCPYCGRKLS